MAIRLLRRYGVVFRDLVRREGGFLSWRDLLLQYRRMELRGEVRGGRFVSGFTGEQFALPEALEALRAVRKTSVAPTGQELRLSASDPLNLVGIILPGARVPAVPWNFVIFKDGQFLRAIFGRESRSAPAGELTPVLQQHG
jgi:ATP-dependent helicase Lhr and Lhr-like helicase